MRLRSPSANLVHAGFGSATRGVEGNDAHRPTSGFKMDREVDLLTEVVGFERKFGTVAIDDGPYHCDVVTCMRFQGFQTQEALDRHKKNFH